MRRILGLAVVLTLAMAIAPQQAAAQNPLGGAILGGAAGAIIGGAAGGGTGAAIGAAIGASTGAIIAAQGEPRGGGYYYWRRGCYIRRPYGWVRVAPRYCYGPSYYYPRAPIYERDIAETQRLLNELGYDAGPVDGEMGPATRHAIRAFQRDAGLPVTGAFDFGLLNRLRSAQRHGIGASPPPPSSGLDCRTATTATEGAICASPELAALDQQLAAAYRAAIEGSDNSARLRNAQQQWIVHRNSCGADTACIAAAYRSRIAALKMYAPGDSSQPPQASGGQSLNAPAPPETGPWKTVKGPAAASVFRYATNKMLTGPCKDTKCSLASLVDSVSLFYIYADGTPKYAVAAISYSPYHANGIFAVNAIFERTDSDDYAFKRNVTGLFGSIDHVTLSGKALLVTTTTLTDQDARCCPTGSTKWRVNIETGVAHYVSGNRPGS